MNRNYLKVLVQFRGKKESSLEKFRKGLQVSIFVETNSELDGGFGRGEKDVSECFYCDLVQLKNSVPPKTEQKVILKQNTHTTPPLLLLLLPAFSCCF